jgi:hypothetical protein
MRTRRRRLSFVARLVFGRLIRALGPVEGEKALFWLAELV